MPASDHAGRMEPDTSQAVQALFASTLQLHQAGRLAEAERGYRAVLERDARHADAWHFLGVLAHQTGRLDLAGQSIHRAIGLRRDVPTYHNNLGNVYQAQRRWQDAESAYAAALLLKPDYAAAHYNLGLTLQAQRKLAAAAASYTQAIRCRPDYVEAHGNRGNVLHALGRFTEAVESYRQALRFRPDYPEALVNLGNVRKAQGLSDEALAAYDAALRAHPQFAEAHLNKAILLLEGDRLAEAEASCRAALTCRPQFPEAHTVLGNVLRERGNPADARAAYGESLRLAPQSGEARLGLTVAALPVYVADAAAGADAVSDFSRSLEELAAWDAVHPGRLGPFVGAYQPFYLAYRPGDLREPLSRYGDLMGRAAAQEWQPQPPVQATPHAPRDRLRLLIVSGQVRRHPVWDVLLHGIVAHIDRRRIEVILCHTGSRRDSHTDWAAAHVDRFIQGPRSVAHWVGEIAEAAPDVVFHPEVGMDPVGGALASLRLAPLQLAGWGHPVTTGLPTIDRFLSGDLLEGPGADSHYRESLRRLPGTGVLTAAPTTGARPWNGPTRPAGAVRFALCQQPIKFDPADDGLLARIARGAGPCEFWLVAPIRHAWATDLLHRRLTQTFRAAGLDAGAQVRIAPWMDHEQFPGFLDAMDVFLDCPAFSGYTTAWQAVHRGLPIVTLEGEFLRQRLAAGLLRFIGVPDGIASNRDDYCRLAVERALECRDPRRRDARRREVGEHAPRADGNEAAVRAFERALAGT
jgi:protein O-GlcNAc transferase